LSEQELSTSLAALLDLGRGRAGVLSRSMDWFKKGTGG
jgi:hypothetical protein